jgi:hypothetical protein
MHAGIVLYPGEVVGRLASGVRGQFRRDGVMY